MQWNRDRRGKVGMMRLGVVDQDGVPCWALSLLAAVLLAFLSCPTWSSKTDGPGLAGAMTMMISYQPDSELCSNALAMVGPVNHVFGSRDINPAPSVAVYSITGVNASSAQWKLQSKQWPNWILWDGAGKIPEPDRVGLRCELPASGGMGW